MRNQFPVAVTLAVTTLLSVVNSAPAQYEPGYTGRVPTDLQVLYDFRSDTGDIVVDRSKAGTPINLRIADPKAVVRTKGALEVRGKTSIGTEKPPARLLNAVQKSGVITVEAWIKPANTKQDGPARIVTLSRNPNTRNFTLGQDGDRFDARMRTTRTSTNGIPSLQTQPRTVTTNKTHVVYSRHISGEARLFINGKRVAERPVGGTASNWDSSMQLGLANEFSGDRPWLGTFYLVAIYSRDLTAKEIHHNFLVGPDGSGESDLAKLFNRKRFETRIAPLLANHCVECHDPATRKGGLVLSRKKDALAGGEGGKAIVPEKLDESLLWTLVESDEMPKNRPPLSDSEKQLLKDWILVGADWTLDEIDPAVYVHDGRAGKAWIQRLTIDEYIETVRSAIGVNIEKEAREQLPPDLRADGFNNTAYNLGVDLKHVDAYSKLAGLIVSRMDVDKFTQRFSRSRRLIDDDNRDLISKMGRWVLRGPLDEAEIVSYRGIATTVASSGGSFTEAMSYILEAMLQSPRFVYRIESQRGDGTVWPVSQHELASRLSYIIWGGPPDEALLKAADEGRLDAKVTAAQADRMLKDPRAKRRSQQFLSQWLNLGRLSNMKPDTKHFPNWDPSLAGDMRTETLAFFDEIVWTQNRPMSDLLNAQVTFATPQLARHYGLKPADDGLTRYDLKETPGRGGLLTHGSVLTVGGDEASMVTRGLFVMQDLLRGVVKDPPPCVDTTPVPTKAGLTQRAIAEARIADKNCGGCHAKFEPLAFGLEKFDGLGAFHDKDRHGNTLREDGQILIPGEARAVKYKSSSELMDLLAGSDRIRQTLTWKVAQFAMGRPLVAADAPVLAKIHEAAWKAGGTYPNLVRAIVTSDLVQMSQTEPDD
jgi:hypothetical protein